MVGAAANGQPAGAYLASAVVVQVQVPRVERFQVIVFAVVSFRAAEALLANVP